MRETLNIKLILCPIDFSEFSVSAYQHALSVAEHYQAKLVAQHIVEMCDILPPTLLPLRDSMRSTARRFARAATSNCRNSSRTTPR